MKIEGKINDIEKEMGKDPQNIEIIEEYTSLLEQFNNI
jgi:hypothetical protein